MSRGVIIASLAACLCLQFASAIRFYLEPGQRRCFTEELPSASKVTGETRVTGGRGDMDIDVWVTTTHGKVLYHKRAAEHGKFSFSTPTLHMDHDDDEDDDYDYGDESDEDAEEDSYKICIEHQQQPSRAHPVGTRRGIYFKLHQSFNGLHEGAGEVARASDTDNLQARMRDMHTTLSGMIGDLSQLQRRERALTNRMRRTTSRVTVLAIFSMLVALGTSALQFKYYQGYFKQKKLC